MVEAAPCPDGLDAAPGADSGRADRRVPVYVTLVASTHTAQAIVQAPMPLVPASNAANYTVLIGTDAGAGSAAPVGRMMFVSLVSALTIALGKIAISLLSAFASSTFDFRFAISFLGDLRHADAAGRGAHRPHYVVSDLGMLNSYAGLTVPLIASATATFLFRQFFLTVPDELAEAARIDGAGPMRFFWDVLLPLSPPACSAIS